MNKITTTPEYLDLYKKALGLTSDYQIHKIWSITRAYVSNLRLGKQSLTPDQCEEIAKASGVPLTKILADMQAERAERLELSPTIAAAWRKISSLIDENRASGAIPAVLAFLPSDQAEAAVSAASAAGNSIATALTSSGDLASITTLAMYIMSNSDDTNKQAAIVALPPRPPRRLPPPAWPLAA